MRALATYLLAAQHLSLARTAKLLTELLGTAVVQGSLALGTPTPPPGWTRSMPPWPRVLTA